MQAAGRRTLKDLLECHSAKGSELDLYLHLVLDLRSFSKEHFFYLNCLWRHFKLSGRRNSFHTAEDFLPCSLTFSLTTATLYNTNARTHTHAKQQLTSAGQPSRMARAFGKLESKGCEVWTRRVPWRQTQSDSLAGETLYISTKTQGEPDSPGWGGEFATVYCSIELQAPPHQMRGEQLSAPWRKVVPQGSIGRYHSLLTNISGGVGVRSLMSLSQAWLFTIAMC